MVFLIGLEGIIQTKRFGSESILNILILIGFTKKSTFIDTPEKNLPLLGAYGSYEPLPTLQYLKFYCMSIFPHV